jgi:hypothetical protein
MIAKAPFTALGSLFGCALLLSLAGCGQSPSRTAVDAVVKAPTALRALVPKVDAVPQLRLAAQSGHHQMNVFPAFGRTFMATKGYVAEIAESGLTPRPELAKGLETSAGQPVGFYGTFPNDAYAVAIRYGERSESYEVYKWENTAWKASGPDHSGYANFFTAPDGKLGAFQSYGDTPFMTLDRKPMASAPGGGESRYASIASLSEGILALEEAQNGRAPRVVRWSKAGNTFYDLPLLGVALEHFHVVQMKAKGMRAMVLGTIGGSDNGAGQMQSYVAAFDGRVWSRIDSSATVGEPSVGQLGPDGTLYLRTTSHRAAPGGGDTATEHLWVRPVGGNWSSIDLPTTAGGAKCWYQDIEADEYALWLTASCDNDEGPQHVLFTSHPAYANGREPEKITVTP